MRGRTIRELRQRWQPLDPARGDHWRPGPAARERGLRAILAAGPPDPLPFTAQRAPRRMPRRQLLAATGALAVAGSIGTVVALTPGPVLAVTPPRLVVAAPPQPVAAAVRLRQIAAGIVPTAAPGDRPGPVDHLVVDQWALHSRIDDEQVDSAVVPARQEIWRTDQNAGRVITRYLPPVFRSAAERQAWQDAGSPGADAPTVQQDFPAAGFPGMWPQRPPAASADLHQWLRRDHPGADAVVTAIADLLAERVLTPRERAAVLRVLADVPNLAFAGTTQDRAGRPGEAYTVGTDASGLPSTVTFIVDPGTGVVLAHEIMLTTDAGHNNVRLPAVIRYDTYVTAEFRPSLP